MSNAINSINANASAAANSSTSTVPTKSSTLTQADFLKIMIAQFSHQDPLSSGSGGSGGSGTSDYVTQLMSMTNLTTLQTMSGQQAQQLAQSLPGANVQVKDNGAISSGVVTSARVDGATGAVFFTVGGAEYPSNDLYSINQPVTPTTTTTTTTTP